MTKQTIKASADKVTKSTVRFALGDEGNVRGSVYIAKSVVGLDEDATELPEGGLRISVAIANA
jgi:hypothetical protein